MIDVKKTCCPLHSILLKIDSLLSIPIFCISFFLIVIISGAFFGCAPKQMTLDEAKQTTISMRGKSFVPPPRSIDDILNMLDKEKVKHLSTGKVLLNKLRSEPPMGASESQLYRFYFERGEAAFFLGYLHQSLYDFQKAYDLSTSESPKSRILDDPMQHITIMNYLAWVEKLLGNYHKAIALLRKAAEVENVMSYSNLSRLYAEVGDFDEAAKMRSKGIAFFEKVMRSSSPNYKAVLFRARMEYVHLESIGRFGDAEQYHQEAVRQALINHSNRPSVSIDEKGKLALNLLNQKRLVEAEITARQVIEESTRLSGMESAYVINYLQVLAEIFLAQGRLKHAEEIIKVALQLHENIGITSESQYYCLSKNTLGKILIATGNYSGAADHFEFFREKEHSNRYLYEIYYSQNIDAMLALAMTARNKEIMPLIENAYRKSQKVFGENYLQTAELLGIRGIATTKSGELGPAFADLSAAIPVITKQMENIESLINNYRVKIIIESYLDLLARIKGSALEKRLGIDASVEAFQIADVLKDQVVQGSVLASAARMTIEDKDLAELVRSEQDVKLQINAYQNLMLDMFSRPSSDHYLSMIGLIVPPVIAVMEPLRSVPKATSDGSSNYGFSPPFGVVFSAL